MPHIILEALHTCWSFFGVIPLLCYLALCGVCWVLWCPLVGLLEVPWCTSATMQVCEAVAQRAGVWAWGFWRSSGGAFWLPWDTRRQIGRAAAVGLPRRPREDPTCCGHAVPREPHKVPPHCP